MSIQSIPSFDPPQFNTSLFNNNAFIDTTELLTLGNANNLYLKKLNPTANGILKCDKLLIKDSTDTANIRLISALDNSQNISESRYLCFGKSNSLNNQAEISFYLNGDGSSINFLALGLYGGNTLFVNGQQRVGIGISNPLYQFQLSTDSAGKPSTSTWIISSDERIKEDIKEADYKLCYENIKNLELSYYKYKDEFVKNHDINDIHKLGWIAQNVEKIIPKAVTTNNNEEYNIEDFKSLNIDQIITNLYGAIKFIINNLNI